MILNSFQYNNSLKKKKNKQFYKTIKTLIPQTPLTSIIYNIQNDINEKEIEYKKISIQDKKGKLKNELTELFDDEEDQEVIITITKVGYDGNGDDIADDAAVGDDTNAMVDDVASNRVHTFTILDNSFRMASDLIAGKKVMCYNIVSACFY